MAIGLRQECKTRLTQSITEIISHAVVNHGTYLDSESLGGIEKLDSLLPGGDIRKNLEDYIGETPVSTFVYETISKDIYESNEYDSESNGIPLISFTKYRDPQAVAKNLVQDFDSLPFRYSLSYEFPSAIGKYLHELVKKSFSFSNAIKIITPDAEYDDLYPLESGIVQRDKSLFDSFWVLENIGKRESKKWNQEVVYLQIETEGFVGLYQTTSPVIKAITILKSLYGISIALNFIHIDRKRLFRPRMRHLVIHQNKDKQWEIIDTFKLPIDFAEVMDNFDIVNTMVSDDNKNSIKLQNLWLGLMSSIFRDSTRNRQILLASRWLLDSYIGDNELLSFVQTMIAMEVLLGGKESDHIGITELIANRCAYLIGENRDEIKHLIKDIKEIYKVRSAIVHHGKSRLNAHDKRMFYTLRARCRQVILKEIMFILKDAKSGKQNSARMQ